MKPFNVLQWYKVLWMNYHVSAFHAMRFVLWLVR
jgi:hypothetical protein